MPRRANTPPGTDALPPPSRRRGLSMDVHSSRRRVVPSANVSGTTFVDASSSQCRDGSQTLDASDSENGDTRVVRVSRPRSRKEPTSSQIGFYTGHWFHILNSAKALYRYYIHTNVAFPERNDKNLKYASECILESLQQYLDENRRVSVETS